MKNLWSKIVQVMAAIGAILLGILGVLAFTQGKEKNNDKKMDVSVKNPKSKKDTEKSSDIRDAVSRLDED